MSGHFGFGYYSKIEGVPLQIGFGHIVELGCGRRKVELDDAVIGVDRIVDDAVDIHTDLAAATPYWNWAEERSCRLVIAHQTLEHIEPLLLFMREVWRICDESAFFEVVVPYGVSNVALQDPTHVRFFVPDTFRYWEPDFVSAFTDYFTLTRDEGYFAICEQAWHEDGNLWTLLAPLRAPGDVARWRELKAQTRDGIVRWPAPKWLLDRRAMLLGEEER